MPDRISLEILTSANPKKTTGMENDVSIGGFTSILMTKVEGGTGLLRDWGNRSENSIDNLLPERDYQRQKRKRQCERLSK